MSATVTKKYPHVIFPIELEHAVAAARARMNAIEWITDTANGLIRDPNDPAYSLDKAVSNVGTTVVHCNHQPQDKEASTAASNLLSYAQEIQWIVDHAMNENPESFQYWAIETLPASVVRRQDALTYIKRINQETISELTTMDAKYILN